MNTARERCLFISDGRGRAGRLWMVAVGIVLGLAAPTPVAATAVSSASASLTLTIIGVTGADLDDLTIEPLTRTDGGFDDYGTGRLDAYFRDEFDFPVWRQEVSASAYAEPTPWGWALAFAEMDSYLYVYSGPDVLPDDPILLEFRVEWSVSASAVVDNPSA